MPGHGASSQADAGLSIDDRAAVLGEILDRQVEGPAVLVGNSIGAFVAAALAARTPGRVKALLLVEMQIRPRAWWDAAWPLVDRMFGTPRQAADTVQRSEERRVGKGGVRSGRSRWWPGYFKK